MARKLLQCPLSWGRVVVTLVGTICILQVVYLSLLNQLESKRLYLQSKDDQASRFLLSNLEMMQDHIKESSTLDSSGEYKIVTGLTTLLMPDPKEINLLQDVTISTQCSLSNLHYLIPLSEAWQGPVSLTLFSGSDSIEDILNAVSNLRRCYLHIRHNVSFHLVYPLSHPPSEMFHASNKLLPCKDIVAALNAVQKGKANYQYQGIPYPVNLLRNTARKNVHTLFSFVTDIDMLPSAQLHQQFVKFAKINNLFSSTSNFGDKTVYVVPAFESHQDSIIAKSKNELLKQLNEGRARPFYFELCLKCQKHTDYSAWQKFEGSPDFKVQFEVLWKEPWEPLFISKNNVPLYDERFKQYGKNRISQICELHMAGYRFSVLNNAFLVHQGFKTRTSFHKDKSADMERNNKLYATFKNELKSRYPQSTRAC